MAYFLLGDKDEGIACVEVNVDFDYDKDISRAVLAQMRAGKLELALIPDELKKLSDEKAKAEQIQTKTKEKRKLTWEEIERVTSKYGFEKSGNGGMVRDWEHGRLAVQNRNWIGFFDDYCYAIRPGLWYGSTKDIYYSDLRNDPKLGELYLYKLLKEVFDDEISDELLESTVSALMELKNLE